eukprot:ANDGO_04898.mRNA.1 hypothetical protein
MSSSVTDGVGGGAEEVKWEITNLLRKRIDPKSHEAQYLVCWKPSVMTVTDLKTLAAGQGYRIVKRRGKDVFVEWEDTWEAEQILQQDVPHLLAEFEQKESAKPVLTQAAKQHPQSPPTVSQSVKKDNGDAITTPSKKLNSSQDARNESMKSRSSVIVLDSSDEEKGASPGSRKYLEKQASPSPGATGAEEANSHGNTNALWKNNSPSKGGSPANPKKRDDIIQLFVVDSNSSSKQSHSAVSSAENTPSMPRPSPSLSLSMASSGSSSSVEKRNETQATSSDNANKFTWKASPRVQLAPTASMSTPMPTPMPAPARARAPTPMPVPLPGPATVPAAKASAVLFADAAGSAGPFSTTIGASSFFSNPGAVYPSVSQTIGSTAAKAASVAKPHSRLAGGKRHAAEDGETSSDALKTARRSNVQYGEVLDALREGDDLFYRVEILDPSRKYARWEPSAFLHKNAPEKLAAFWESRIRFT